MVLRKNEENESEMFACLKATGFELIPEDDESVIEGAGSGVAVGRSPVKAFLKDADAALEHPMGVEIDA